MTGMQFSPDGRTMLVTTNDSRIRLYDMSDYSMLAKFKGTENDELQIRAWFSQDGKLVICGGENQQVVVWSAQEYMAPDANGGANNAAAANSSATAASSTVGGAGGIATASSNSAIAASALSPSGSSGGSSNSSLSTANSSSSSLGVSSSSSSSSSAKPDVKCDSCEFFRAFNDTCTSAQFLPPSSLRLSASTCENENEANKVRHLIVAAGYSGEIKLFENRGQRKAC